MEYRHCATLLEPPLICQIALVYWAAVMAHPQHVVVIAFENRSFDHMLGFVSPGGVLTGQESNPVNPADPNSERVPVTQLAGPITSVDPNHSLEAVHEQVFGASVGEPDPPPMNGFVSSYIKNAGGDVT